MVLNHPLDRPVWSALTSRQAHLALGDARALRFDPDYALFAAAADASPVSTAALGALNTSPNGLGLVEAGDMPLPPGAVVRASAACVQMVAASLNGGGRTVAFEPLGEADAAEMLALATLTVPGPFFEKTHRLGDFIGVKADGRLVAMAGERMKPAGFTEVSGVCTHPDHRGRGYAGALMRVVTQRILERGEQAFLHAYAANTATIALYETLGFRVRTRITYTVLDGPA
ncbi:MAG: GNAT family N-acetyltransferase [Brevundimonas sp.]|uniref:GNAT family N-acetyltransferase n=1 Tax=Brevundimonas sp. TaxID=1871086 RepID=UPI0026117AD3|nr:GNAT family N-acetyltransferase [Brevundimonas sp.]MDI6625420.1 GNAT family N-acetyltransferase [Brevundimonas sp.]MDQ7813892.1 GNAT family N-acetyltransferase [Brevundimonas sp.]